MTTTTVHIQRRGTFALPVELRRQYNLNQGDAFTLVDLGGAFLLTPQVSRMTRLGGQLAHLMDKEGVSLEEMLETLDQERETY